MGYRGIKLTHLASDYKYPRKSLYTEQDQLLCRGIDGSKIAFWLEFYDVQNAEQRDRSTDQGTNRLVDRP